MLSLLALIEGMEAQGTDCTSIVQAVKAFAETQALASDQIEDQRANNRARQARWRSAQKQKRSANVSITPHNVTEVAPPPPSLFLSPTPPFQNPSSTTPPEKQNGRERASRLAADWTLPLEWQAWAEAEVGPEGQRMSPARVTSEGAKFGDFWRAKAGKDAAKLNWLSTWRNWIRGALERMPAASRDLARVSGSPDAGAAPQLELVMVDGKPTYRPIAKRAA